MLTHPFLNPIAAAHPMLAIIGLGKVNAVFKQRQLIGLAVEPLGSASRPSRSKITVVIIFNSSVTILLNFCGDCTISDRPGLSAKKRAAKLR